MVIRKLTKGSFGHIYLAIDMNHQYGHVVCKINNHKDMHVLEAHVLKLLNDSKFTNFPKLISNSV